MSAARRQEGFTLIELLVAMTVGLVVLFAAFSLVDLAVSSQVETENRLDATQRGRAAMENVTRSLRSQLCSPTGGAPIEIGEDNRVKFYSSLVSEAAGSVELQKRVITYEPVAGPTRGRLVERVYLNKGTAAQPQWNDTAGNDVPDRTRVIADHVTPVTAATPVFRYARYDASVPTGDPAQFVPLTTPLSAADRPLVVQVRVAFDSWSTGTRKADRVHVALDSRIQARTADPNDPVYGAKCL